MTSVLPLLASCLLAAPPADPVAEPVTAEVATTGTIWVGGRVTVAVTLYSPTFFAAAPAFDLPTIPGVVTVPPQGRPVVGSEEVAGRTFTTQRHELAVYPQRAGEVRLPPIRVRFASDGGPGKPPVPAEGRTKPLTFTATMPPGAESLSTVLTTASFSLKETWNPEPSECRTGAAFVRTVTMTAKSVPAMALPPVRWSAPEGVRVYPSPPSLSDRDERGETTGQRVEKATYVCEAAGDYRLPGLSMAWWDPGEKKLRREKLPARTFAVTAPPKEADPAPAEPDSVRRWWPVVSLLLTGSVLAAGVTLAARLRAATPGSERRRFVEFRRACETGDAKETYRRLSRWLWARPANADTDAGFRRQAEALEAVLFGETGGTWSPQDLLREAERLRGRKEADRHGRAVLSDLNPGGESNSTAARRR